MYEALELVGVARKLPVAEWQSERGETVSNKEEAVGKKVLYKVTHLDYLVYQCQSYNQIPVLEST